LYDSYQIYIRDTAPISTQKEEKSKVLPPKFEMRNLPFHVYQIADNINIIKTSDAFLIFLIILNANFMTMSIYLIVSTVLSNLEKDTVEQDANWTHIVFKLIHFALVYIGNGLLKNIPDFYGEEEVVYENAFLLMIGVFLLSEIVRVVFLYNSIKPRVTYHWIGKYLIYFLYLYFNYCDLQQLKFYVSLSLLMQCVSTVSFVLFVIFKK
jgi:hypothetical protein